LAEIADAINLDTKNLEARYNTEEKFILCDSKFGYNEHHGHDPQKLLLIGFLYCSYEGDAEEHLSNLWYLANPNFQANVSLQKVLSLLEDILYISID